MGAASVFRCLRSANPRVATESFHQLVHLTESQSLAARDLAGELLPSLLQIEKCVTEGKLRIGTTSLRGFYKMYSILLSSPAIEQQQSAFLSVRCSSEFVC